MRPAATRIWPGAWLTSFTRRALSARYPAGQAARAPSASSVTLIVILSAAASSIPQLGPAHRRRRCSLSRLRYHDAGAGASGAGPPSTTGFSRLSPAARPPPGTMARRRLSAPSLNTPCNASTSIGRQQLCRLARKLAADLPITTLRPGWPRVHYRTAPSEISRRRPICGLRSGRAWALFCLGRAGGMNRKKRWPVPREPASPRVKDCVPTVAAAEVTQHRLSTRRNRPHNRSKPLRGLSPRQPGRLVDSCMDPARGGQRAPRSPPDPLGDQKALAAAASVPETSRAFCSKLSGGRGLLV